MAHSALLRLSTSDTKSKDLLKVFTLHNKTLTDDKERDRTMLKNVYYVTTSRVAHLKASTIIRHADRRFVNEDEARAYADGQKRAKPWAYTYTVQVLETVND